MTKALISIDYTVDFVADDGKLTAGAPAQAISKTIAQVTQTAFDRGDYIFFAIDGYSPARKKSRHGDFDWCSDGYLRSPHSY